MYIVLLQLCALSSCGQDVIVEHLNSASCYLRELHNFIFAHTGHVIAENVTWSEASVCLYKVLEVLITNGRVYMKC